MGHASQTFVRTDTAADPKSTIRPKQPAREKFNAAKTGSKAARDEIYTYVAVRDLLLQDAEVTTTRESLRRANAANEFLETCLQPPRTPYEGQYLREIDAARQRDHCREARTRLAKLREKIH